MNVPAAWQSDAADIRREEDKRERSPGSFFWSQGHALVLAAQYFDNNRLVPQARGAVATKHRHRIHLALFGQLMAAFEFLLKDFVASVIDTVPEFDEALVKADWVEIDPNRVLLFRSAAASPGALLIHPTLGWHDPPKVNSRYQELFKRQPIAKAEFPTLAQLWILRHSVAHNAGYVTAYDARRGGMPELTESVAAIDAAFIADSFAFLSTIAKRLATDVGEAVLRAWLQGKAGDGANYRRDKDNYVALKLIAAYVESRSQPLPQIRKGSYTVDFQAANTP